MGSECETQLTFTARLPVRSAPVTIRQLQPQLLREQFPRYVPKSDPKPRLGYGLQPCRYPGRRRSFRPLGIRSPHECRCSRDEPVHYYCGGKRATASPTEAVARLRPDALGHQLATKLTSRFLRFSSPSFLRRLETWNFAVRSLMFNWTAISLFVRCLKRSWST
jgi:hypothetical protein